MAWPLWQRDADCASRILDPQERNILLDILGDQDSRLQRLDNLRRTNDLKDLMHGPPRIAPWMNHVGGSYQDTRSDQR
jgi:hypothetical protein